MKTGLSFESNEQSLWPVVEKSPLLEVDPNGRIVATDKLDVPLDEFGIPRRVELMRNVIDTLETAHRWTGYYDLHHVAWTGAQYRTIVDGDESIGSLYRGCTSLKVYLPRQLHNYVHAITNQPPVPDIEVMRQYISEHNQVDRLYDTIKITSYETLPELNILPEEEKDRLRYESFQKKLKKMRDGELGIMPSIEYLCSLELAEARSVLRSIARVQGLSNSRRAKNHFFRIAA